MKSKILTAVLVMSSLGLAANAGSMESFAFQDHPNELTTMEMVQDGYRIRVDANWKNHTISYQFDNGTKLFKADVANFETMPTFTLRYKDASPFTTAALTESDFVNNTQCDDLVALHQTVNGEFMGRVYVMLSKIPDFNPNLRILKQMSLAIVGSTTSAGGQTNIAGIFYASCYWGCVAGSGEWLGCGDYCHDIYGTN